MLQNGRLRRNNKSFRRGRDAVSGSTGPGSKAFGYVDRTTVGRHSGKHTGLPRPTKACPCDAPGGGLGRKAGGVKVQSQASPKEAAGRQRRSRIAGNEEMSLKFEIQPAANPTPEKERA